MRRWNLPEMKVTTSKYEEDAEKCSSESIAEIACGAPEVTKRKYEEDVYPKNHTSVWGSWWKDHQWGYRCCKQLVRDSICSKEEEDVKNSIYNKEEEMEKNSICNKEEEEEKSSICSKEEEEERRTGAESSSED